MALYNMTRFVQGLLKTYEKSPPSFTVRLYREYWTLNNGSKFLYNSQTASLLDDIRAQHIPVDFVELFDAAGLPFYEGCLIVELLDYRPGRSNEPELDQPERTRVVLTPNDESRWADICLMSKKAATPWSDADAVEVEARMLLATAPPLCLEPDIHLTRIVNATQRVSTPPAPPSLKRKAAAIDQEADELEKARRIKLMQFMAPQRSVPPGKFPILEALQRYRQMKANPQAAAAAAAAAAQQMPTTVPTTASPHPAAGPSPATTVVPPTVPAVTAPTIPAQAGPAPTSTPVPPATQFLHPPPNTSSPAPANAASPPAPVPNIKKQPPKKKADGVQSPLMPRASVTPAPTASIAPSGGPLPIPPHLAPHFQAQHAARTGTPQPPVQSVPSPRPPSVAHASSPPMAPEQRPPSAVPPAQAQTIQQVQAAQQRPMQPSPAPQVPGQATQSQLVPGAYTPAQIANAIRNRGLAAGRGQPNGQAPQAPGAAAQAQTPQQQQQLYYQFMAFQQAQAQAAHAQAQAAAAQQRLQPGQQQQAAPSPAQHPRSPMPPAQGQPGAGVQRNSPMVQHQQVQPRSPMPHPNTPQQAPQQPQIQQQQQHAQQHAGQGQMQAQHAAQHHPQGANLAYANYMRQLAAQQQHPQRAQQFAAAGQAQQQAGQQQVQAAAAAAAQAAMSNPQMLAQYQQMFNFGPRMGMMPGQMPQGYWMGAGRGMPQNMAGMQGHPQQQMQPGAAKPPQGQQGS